MSFSMMTIESGKTLGYIKYININQHYKLVPEEVPLLEILCCRQST